MTLPHIPPARGTFDVKLNPLPIEDSTAASSIGRRSIDKQYHGDLEAASTGQMLSAGTAVQGSAGYVAIELVSGTLRGRSGTFVLQHYGTMTRGTPHLTVSVVPDSGTGELTGLSGTLNIIIDGKQHSYELDYALDSTP
jgi:hypothetical protein